MAVCLASCTNQHDSLYLTVCGGNGNGDIYIASNAKVRSNWRPVISIRNDGQNDAVIDNYSGIYMTASQGGHLIKFNDKTGPRLGAKKWFFPVVYPGEEINIPIDCILIPSEGGIKIMYQIGDDVRISDPIREDDPVSFNFHYRHGAKPNSNGGSSASNLIDLPIGVVGAKIHILN